MSRVVVLYRVGSSAEWRLLELALTQPATGDWSGQVTGGSKQRVEYIVQAVDAAGNVAWRDDYGSPFVFGSNITYLPVVLRR